MTKKCRADGSEWVTESATEIPFENNTVSVAYVNYIENHLPEVQFILGTHEFPAYENWYKGVFPIFTFGNKVDEKEE